MVLGDEASVNANTVTSLNALSPTDAPVTRLAGADRYATAAAISSSASRSFRIASSSPRADRIRCIASTSGSLVRGS